MPCILYTGQCHPQGTSLDVLLPPHLPSSHAPPLLLSLATLLPPPLASSLPSFPRSVHAYFPSSLVPFLNPPSLPPLPLPPSITSLLPHSVPLPPPFPTLPLLPPSHPPSFLAHPCLPTAVQFNVRSQISKLHWPNNGSHWLQLALACTMGQ